MAISSGCSFTTFPRGRRGEGVGGRQIKLRCVAESDPASQPPDDSAALERRRRKFFDFYNPTLFTKLIGKYVHFHKEINV